MTQVFDPLLPNATAIDKGALRAALDGRLIITFETAAGVTTWTAGSTQAVHVAGVGTFTRDATDVITPHDGISTVVSLDGIRFKKDILLDTVTVLSASLTAPPGGETIGDGYLLLGAPTGDWAGNQNSIAVFTSLGYLFVPPKVGMVVYVTSVDSFYRYKSTAVWELGLGLTAVPQGSIGFRSLEFPAGFTVLARQSTPPGSPVQGEVYIVGTNPTGDWAANTNDIAVRGASAWEFLSPVQGWRAWDRAAATLIFFDGTTWQDAISASHASRTGIVATGGAGVTAMTSGQGSEVVTQVKKVSKATHKIVVNGVLQLTPTGSAAVVGVFFDQETNAKLTFRPIVAVGNVFIHGEITPGDVDDHTYRFRLLNGTFLRLDAELLEIRA